MFVTEIRRSFLVCFSRIEQMSDVRKSSASMVMYTALLFGLQLSLVLHY